MRINTHATTMMTTRATRINSLDLPSSEKTLIRANSVVVDGRGTAEPTPIT